MRFILVLILIFQANMVISAPITIRDNSNRIVGYIDDGKGIRAVRNRSKAIIGYIDNKNTYNKSRRIIMKTPLPGILFCGEK